LLRYAKPLGLRPHFSTRKKPRPTLPYLTEPFISDLLYISGAKQQSSVGEKMVKDYFGGAVGALSILSGIHYISVELLAENE
jgi:hypothetical protein